LSFYTHVENTYMTASLDIEGRPGPIN